MPALHYNLKGSVFLIISFILLQFLIINSVLFIFHYHSTVGEIHNFLCAWARFGASGGNSWIPMRDAYDWTKKAHSVSLYTPTL